MTKGWLKNNKFALIIIFFGSFFTSIIKSIWMLVWLQKKPSWSNFFKWLNFTLKLWPKFFWNKPSGLRFSRFIWDFVNYIFYKK